MDFSQNNTTHSVIQMSYFQDVLYWRSEGEVVEPFRWLDLHARASTSRSYLSWDMPHLTQANTFNPFQYVSTADMQSRCPSDDLLFLFISDSHISIGSIDLNWNVHLKEILKILHKLRVCCGRPISLTWGSAGRSFLRLKDLDFGWSAPGNYQNFTL
jgi:hypothetical protein